MRAADAAVDEQDQDDDVYLSDGDGDKMSLASDLDPDDLEDIQQRQKQMDAEKGKKRYQSFY